MEGLILRVSVRRVAANYRRGLLLRGGGDLQVIGLLGDCGRGWGRISFLDGGRVVGHLLRVIVMLVNVDFVAFTLAFVSPNSPMQGVCATANMVPARRVIRRAHRRLNLGSPFLIRCAE